MITIFVLGLFILDRVIKFSVFSRGEYVINKGLALGMLDDHEFLMYLFLPLVIILIFILWVKFRHFRIPLALIYAGAVSNLIDRLLYNGVIDYIEVWIFPVFNIADIMIVAGVVLLLIFEINNYAKDDHSKRE